MKKIMMILSVMLAGAFAGGRIMAQTVDHRLPVRTMDPRPFVRPAAVKLPVKSGGSGAFNKAIPAGHPAGGGAATAATKGPAVVSLPPIKTTATSGGARN